MACAPQERRGKECDMSTKLKRIIAGLLAVTAVFAAVLPAVPVLGASQKDKKVISLGSGLTGEEKKTVLGILGVSEADLSSYTVITVTEEDERRYLGNYLSEEMFAGRSLSSSRIEPAAAGSGISVKTHNITWCSEAMYQNALATAGVKDADIVIAGPYEVSGITALTGVIRAYEEQEGIIIPAESIDTATDEIVTTGQIGESIGNVKKAAELIGAVKQIIAAQSITGEEDIRDVIRKVASEMGITLSDEDLAKIVELMKKLSALDIDVEELKRQAASLYDELKRQGIDLSEYGIDASDMDGAAGFLARLWASFRAFLHRLGL